MDCCRCDCDDCNDCDLRTGIVIGLAEEVVDDVVNDEEGCDTKDGGKSGGLGGLSTSKSFVLHCSS